MCCCSALNGVNSVTYLKFILIFPNHNTQNPLGIQPRDENKTEHMVEIMHEAHQYVLMVEMVKDYHLPSIGRTVEVVTALAHPIVFAGDQKTAARARGAQKAKVNAVSPSSRPAGLVPIVADWHTKVKLLDVSLHSNSEYLLTIHNGKLSVLNLRIEEPTD